jgi:hypothetical protein
VPGPPTRDEPTEPWLPSIERAKHGSFRELYPADELRLYGVGTAVFIVLALLTRDVVLNWIIGPLFITVWAWYVPVLQERWRQRRGGR